jgi:hypothetical protein
MLAPKSSSSWLIVAVGTCVTALGCGSEPFSQDNAAEPAVVEESSALVSNPWSSFTNTPPNYLSTCLLLTNGDVMCQGTTSSATTSGATNTWHRLRPDNFGSYKNGTWDKPTIAPMPNGKDTSFGCNPCTYAPTYFSSAVLPDGRVVVIGGEFNGLSTTTTPAPQVETNIGFIYDPVTDVWSAQLTEVFGGGSVGDTKGTILEDGTFTLANNSATGKDLEVLDPTTGTFTAKNSTGKLDPNNEENWTILPDGSILTVDSSTASSFERYTPSKNTWGNSGTTQVNLADTSTLGSSNEVGPCVGRPDGTFACFSGNSLGQNAVYTPSTNSFTHATSMDFPASTNPVGHFSMKDGVAAALPNGNVLVIASPVDTNKKKFYTPSHFYEMSTSNTLAAAAKDSPNAASFKSYQARMLVLPTGEVLLTAWDQAQTQDVQLYSNGGAPSAAARPNITTAPSTIEAGGIYTISGTQFNGYSEGAHYGDDAQSSTNYPLVRLTTQATGHVVYARTFGHSRMGIESVGSSAVTATSFEVPTTFEGGPATIEVVANGIASNKLSVNSTYTPLTLLNGWKGNASGGNAAAASVVNGIVQLHGAISISTGNANPFTLPTGYRPSANVYVPVNLCNATFGRLFIQNNGIVTVQAQGALSNAECFTSLEGVSFPTSSSGFTAVTYQNGWHTSVYGTNSVGVKNDGGIIRFEGAMQGGTTALAFTLPAAFAPPTDVYIPTDLCASNKGRLHIQPSGNVSVETEGPFSDAQCFTSLDGATYALSAAGFTPLGLQNGWSNAPYSTRNAAVSVDTNGTVRFQGAVSGGSSSFLGTLPVGFRPAFNIDVNVDMCNAHQGRLGILPTGEVDIYSEKAFSDAQCFTSLEGVSFSGAIAATPLTLQNGWKNNPYATTAATAINVNGVVQLTGAISTTGNNQQPFTLPVGYRPTAVTYVPVDLCNAALGRLYIRTDGTVLIETQGPFSDAQCFTSLEGVSFATDGSGFTSLALQNGWTTYGFGTRDPAVFNDHGIVRFVGAMANGTSASAFNLPAGLAPPTDVYVPVDLCNSAKGRIHVTSSGAVDIETAGPFTDATCFTSLEGATFALSASGFTSVPLTNGWSNAPFSTRNVAVKNDNDGIVRLQGAIAGGASAKAFILPAGFRPAAPVFVNVDLCDAAQGRVQIWPSGEVDVVAQNSFSDASCFTSLEGVSFAN